MKISCFNLSRLWNTFASLCFKVNELKRTSLRHSKILWFCLVCNEIKALRLQRILTTVYNTHNHWAYGLAHRLEF
jgi:hypothetical protein